MPTTKDAASTFESLTDQQQKEVLWKLVDSANQYNDLGVAYNIIKNKYIDIGFVYKTFVTSPYCTLGKEISQYAADDANGTSLENGDSSLGTANGAGLSTNSSGSDAVVSSCAFPHGPTVAELREVKCEEGRVNDGDLIWKLVKSRRRKREEKTVKAEKAATSKPTKRANTHASRRRGGKSTADTATPIPAPKTPNIGDNAPLPVMIGHGFNKFRDITYIDPSDVPILGLCFQMGVAKESIRKGVLDIEEECEKKLPSLLVSYHHDITAWLTSRL